MISKTKIINPDIELLQNAFFESCNLNITDIRQEPESIDYNAHTFKLNAYRIKFRTAKITPHKIGQFVSIWKRNHQGITVPHDIQDDFDYYIILTKNESSQGLFVFPSSILYDNKILSGKTSKGKRGIRVYPAWDTATNKQAQKTQNWQLKYFLELSNPLQIDRKKAGDLFS